MRKQAVSSLKWSFIQQFSTQIINYISVIIIAGLVDPAIQGFVTIASIPLGFVGVLGSFGVREKIIKEKEIDELYKESLLSFIMLISVIAFLLSTLCVVLIAFFYKSNFDFTKMLQYGLLISSINPIIIFNHYFESFQTRELNFKGISFVNSISLLVGISISVLLAYLNYDYLAVSLKMVLPHLFNLILYLIYFKPSLNYRWNPTMYKEFKTFSTYLTLNNIANYFVRNIDYIIIGKFFNADILGQYSIAYKILLFPMKNITSRIQSVAMPMLSKLDINSQYFKQKYSMIISLIAFIVFPMMSFVAITTDIWVPLTFNIKYDLLIMMISVLAIVGTFQSLVSPVGVLYLLEESTKLMFRNSIINAVVIALVFLISSFWGNIYTVLIAYASSWLLLILPISIYWIYKEYQMKMSSFFYAITPAFFSILISLGIVFLYKFYIPISQYKILQLIILFVLMIGAYMFSYYLLNKEKDRSLIFYYKLIRGK
jgi:O-antigen/teichoic acid export membrane protein